MISTAPTATCCQNGCTPTITKPLRSTAGMKTPTTVPTIVPTPPNRLVPPMTMAAIASRFSVVLPAMDVVPKRASDSAPANPASAPHSAYTLIKCRSTLTPVRRTPSSLEPIAYVYRPNRVWARMIPNTSATTAAITTSHGICPNSRPVPMVSTSLNGTSRSSTPPVISSAAPRAMPRVPSVTMNDGILALVTRKPLRIPQATPASRPTMTPTMMTPQLSPPTAFMARAETTLANTRTDPTDRSMPAVMITYVRPVATTSSTAASVAMLRALETVKNSPNLRIEKIAIIAIST